MTDEKYIELIADRQKIGALQKFSGQEKMVYLSSLLFLGADGLIHADDVLLSQVRNFTGLNAADCARALSRVLDSNLFKSVGRGAFRPTEPFRAPSERSIDKDEPVLPEKEVRLRFEACRRLYGGRKRGFETEYENFRKKVKGYELDEVLTLMERSIDAENKIAELRKLKGERPHFFKNFLTFVNQRSWEYADSLEKECEKLKLAANTRFMMPT